MVVYSKPGPFHDEDRATGVCDDALRSAAHQQPRNTTSAVRSDDDQVDIEMIGHLDDLIKRISHPEVRLDLDSLFRELLSEQFEVLPRLKLGGIDVRLNLRAILPSACIRSHYIVRYLKDVKEVNRRVVPYRSSRCVPYGAFGMLREINRNENSRVIEFNFILLGNIA